MKGVMEPPWQPDYSPPSCSRLFICRTLTLADGLDLWRRFSSVPGVWVLKTCSSRPDWNRTSQVFGFGALKVKGRREASRNQLFLACCYQAAVRRGSAESQSAFSPLPRPEPPAVALVGNLHLLRSWPGEQPG